MKTLFIAAAALALLTVPAFAHPTAYHPLTSTILHQIEMAEPIPAAFNPAGYAVTNGDSKNFIVTLATGQRVMVHLRSHRFIREKCGNDADVYACTWSVAVDVDHSVFPQIVVDEAIPAALFPRVLRHELAHTLGWHHR